MNSPGPGTPEDSGARPDRSLLRQVALPSEHGAWAFLAEPIALGLLVAFSVEGLFIALAAVAAFLARRPLRLLVSDRLERKRHPRTPLAERALAGYALLGVFALAAALSSSGRAVLVTLGLGAPFAVAALVFDLRQHSRELAAEVAGALAFVPVATGVALAGGWSLGPALGLALILSARTVPSILYVRARLRLERSRPADLAAALAAHVAGIALAIVLASFGLAPWLGAAALALLGLRAAYGLSARRPAMSVVQLGVSEIVFGAVTILAVVAGVAWGV
jgi:hypothetical protein